MSLLEITK